MSVQPTLGLVVAQAPGGGNPGGQGEDFGKSSPVGLLLLVLFGIAVAFLVRSMSKHLKKLPTTFDEEAAEAAAPRRARAASSGPAADPGTPDAEAPDAEDAEAEAPDAEAADTSSEAPDAGADDSSAERST